MNASTDNATAIRQKLEALRELKLERDKREAQARTLAYENEMSLRGEIPVLILDEPDQDAQRKRLLAELGEPGYWIEHPIIDPPPCPEVVCPATKAHVEDVQRAEEQKSPGPNASYCMTMEYGEPIFYLFDPANRVITLAENGGTPTWIGGKLFQEKLERNQNADDLAVTLWLRARGKSGDDFDGPIIYPAEQRLPRGA